MNLNGYVLYEPIGFGAKGPIWRAVDTQGQNFALQVIGAKLPAGLEERIAKLQKLDSSHVLRVQQLRKVTDGRYVVLSEFLEGQNLEILRAGRQLSIEQVYYLGRSLAAGLADLHDAGLLHGDISPANAMITSHGRVLWVDVLGTTEGITPQFYDSGFLGANDRRVSLETHHLTAKENECLDPGNLKAATTAGKVAEVFAFAQMMLALGMDAQLLGAALHTDASKRPTMREICQAWKQLPTAGVELLTSNELTSAKMRAAGRDVATTAVGRDFANTSLSPKKARINQRRNHLSASSVHSRSAGLLKITIPVLGSAAVVLSLVLMLPRLLPTAGAMPETAEPVTTASANLPRPGEILTPASKKPVSKEKTPVEEDQDSPEKDTSEEESSQISGAKTSEAEESNQSLPNESAPQNLLPPAGPDSIPAKDLLDTGKITTDEEATAVLQELLSRRDKAIQAGDMKSLAALTERDSVIQKADADLVLQLKNSQTKIDGLVTAVKSVKLMDANKNQIRLRVTLAQGAYTQTDRIGNQHVIAPLPDATQEMLLLNHPWRIASVVRLHQDNE